jgi:pyruvate/2-oxoglutarate dehydrogenase complex dihydrolipoamide acyltransferase (E2) component
VTQALRAGRRITPVHGLITVDVTEARRLLESIDPRPSFTAFLVASVGRAAVAHPEVHAYRNWRGQLVLHHHVDIATLVEVHTPEGSFPLAHLVRDADRRDVNDISTEIRRVKNDPASSRSGQLLTRVTPAAAKIPGAVPLFYRLMAQSVRMRRMAGTVAVTSVGMFAGGGGFGIGFPTVLTLSVLVGGLSERPRIIDSQVEARQVLDLTVTVDHNVVDGAPAARFVADMRRLIEQAEVLQ